MNYTITLICTFSIVIAAVTGLIRFKKIDQPYQPFLLFIWLSFFNECLSVLLAYTIRNNVINNNIFFLLQALIITWQFNNLKLFGQKHLFPILLALLSAGWLSEILIFSSINRFCSYFIVAHSFFIVLFSISMLNRLIVNESIHLLTNSIFLICIAFIIYFTLAILTEIFWLYGLNESSAFASNIQRILRYANLFANLLYALAVVWMPARPRFILLS
ncbi:MAG: hypothetical protein JWP69_1327 [Flaviaesturariibacter sp.]|nr:hypothetical protein [Flaviaesturariibacter sp.]